MPFKTGNWGEQAQRRSEGRYDYFRAYQKQRYIKNSKVILAASKRRRNKYPDRVRAESLAYYHIKIPDGKLCEECHDTIATQRHHPDYSQPLNVVFLCSSCHRRKAGEAR